MGYVNAYRESFVNDGDRTYPFVSMEIALCETANKTGALQVDQSRLGTRFKTKRNAAQQVHGSNKENHTTDTTACRQD
jgi:hypothetical protein